MVEKKWKEGLIYRNTNEDMVLVWEIGRGNFIRNWHNWGDKTWQMLCPFYDKLLYQELWHIKLWHIAMHNYGKLALKFSHLLMTNWEKVNLQNMTN